MAEGNLITPEDLDLQVNTKPLSLKEAKEQTELKMITEALERNRGNVSKSAKELEITRPTLHDLMKKYNLSKQDFK
jgi:two-component system NtrC family response regulator